MNMELWVTILILLEIILQLYGVSVTDGVDRVTILILLEIILQLHHQIPVKGERVVTILILLEIILQRNPIKISLMGKLGYNPYFIGNHSATEGTILDSHFAFIGYNPYFIGNHSATKTVNSLEKDNISYNPYFIGNHSATKATTVEVEGPGVVTILILLEIILQRD